MASFICAGCPEKDQLETRVRELEEETQRLRDLIDDLKQEIQTIKTEAEIDRDAMRSRDC